MSSQLPETNSDPRELIYQKLGQIALALGSPSRLKLIQILSQSPRTVEELSERSGQSVANTSQHLQRMAKEGLVACQRQGVSRIYRLANPRVLELWESLQLLAHELFPQLDEAEVALTDATLHAEATAAEVVEAVIDKKAVLLDVRESEESGATPVPESLWVPMEQLKAELKRLPRQKTIYVFCRGRYCGLASQAVKALRAAGFKAYRLRESSFRLNQLLGSGRKPRQK
ncbi:MAG: metalloregulator ArsR/SmtB family transcription factor [Oligoflexia bacterium]|nr:metalloregulator ArsR/SmtB family transcription factor [Oligoflexia bacterium]